MTQVLQDDRQGIRCAQRIRIFGPKNTAFPSQRPAFQLLGFAIMGFLI